MSGFKPALRVLITAIAAIAQAAAHAAQPPDVVDSDTHANTAAGSFALLSNTAGTSNTALGYVALQANTYGGANTAVGAQALQASLADYDTAVGYQALSASNIGNNNTAMGAQALQANTGGGNNTALGEGALNGNTTGSHGTAAGTFALVSNTTGAANNAFGDSALYFNTTGANNTAFGFDALFSNTTGKGNAAQGVNALYSNTTGIRNLGIGSNALYTNSTGSYNIALGFDAGYNVINGSNNIEIGAQGSSDDNATIQIGVQGTQNHTSIAGIYGTPVTGTAVYVTATGQLGMLGSSERFKTDIASMPPLFDKLRRLRPVIFHYKTDPKRVTQYGLIAEEVATIYPELVIRDDAGKIQGVRYEELSPMLLHALQQQQDKIQALETQLAAIQALLEKSPPTPEMLAQR